MLKSTYIHCGLLTLVWSAQPAYAYLDPGTGTIIVQSIIGGIAAATTFGAVYWAKIKSFFERKPDASDS